ncbi:MAG: hypothetical protein IKN82_08060 [Treponema sp.]|nr:hypothetical protein [Treponema sp.]
MKKFLFKLLFLAQSIIVLFFLRPKILQAWKGFHYDTFNVFHWKKIRFLNTEPNQNFIKTSYIVNNPKKFNAFVFGSSRVRYLPQVGLPNKIDETELRWYNMTYSEGIPAEHVAGLKTFINANVDIKMIMAAFDNIAMYASVDIHEKQLMRMPYQVYEKNPLAFYIPYLNTETDDSIISQVLEYDPAPHEQEFIDFYNYGGVVNDDFSLTENPNYERFKSMHFGQEYTQQNALDDIAEIASICKERGIKLILITNPIYETTYKDAVEHGYFDLLKYVSQKCEFYNFSSLNNYTKDPHYYFESSHYRPALGILVEKVLFGTEEEKTQIRKDAGDELWGAKVNAENVDFVIQNLRGQLEKSE